MKQEIKQKPEKTGNIQDIRDVNGRFIKGFSGNPSGKPTGSKSFTTKVKEALEKIAEGKDYTYEEAFIKSILKKAIVDGDSATQRLIWNYLDGMPRQATTIGGDENNPIPIIGISDEQTERIVLREAKRVMISREIAEKNDMIEEESE
ncbi:MAG: DUF5681 domain-containing protein [Candidatus Paceibacterota bacterium]